MLKHMASIQRIIVIVLFLLTLFMGACSSRADSNVRYPAVAGSFYSANAKNLQDQIQTYLSRVVKGKYPGNIIAALAPHAGYVYSGPVAAYTYKYIQDLDIETVVLIGPCHRVHQVGLKGISIYPEGFYETPLGRVKVDSKLAKAFMAEGTVYFSPSRP
ncbi:AmmeMemoRadiSam system protein B [candidate division CSSED10-310 bacterium]|uniref:AmmeMemoRadiSam system protein B n=1 Tax=candidate division CSSED10-310 bacterium TaxID=2855610 RepID=A0ABV6YYI0_UNCC1